MELFQSHRQSSLDWNWKTTRVCFLNLTGKINIWKILAVSKVISKIVHLATLSILNLMMLSRKISAQSRTISKIKEKEWEEMLYICLMSLTIRNLHSLFLIRIWMSTLKKILFSEIKLKLIKRKSKISKKYLTQTISIQ